MSKLKQRLLVVLRWSLFPLFYVLCLVAFFYATFPWDRVKDRIIAEFDATQAKKGAEAQRLEIGSITGYWFTGVEVENAKLVIPPTAAEIAAAELAARRAADDDGDEAAADAGDDEEGGDATGAAKAPKKKAPTRPRDTVLLIDRATARVELWPLLTGRVQVSFHADAFGGSIDGSIPVQGTGDVELALENVDLGQVGIIKSVLTMPLRGIATGELTLTRGEGGKLSKSTGALSLVVEDAVIGDGKAKIANMITLPPAKLGKVEIAAAAEGGQLKIAKFGAAGGDLELSAEGVVKLKDRWKSSALDLYLRFRFADEYRSRDDKTKVIFGEPGSRIPGLIDTQPKIKRAKRGDDSYGIHVYGSLKAPKYEPWTTDDASSGGARRKGAAAAADDDDAADDADDAGDADAPPANGASWRGRSRDRTTTPPPRPTPRPPPPPREEREQRDERRIARPPPEPPPQEPPPPLEPVMEAPAVDEAPPPEAPPDEIVEEAPAQEDPTENPPPEDPGPP